MKYPLLGTMSESQAYQNMFSEKNSFLINHPELDKELWQKMKQWLAVDMTPPQTPEPETKKVAEPKPTTYRSLLKKRY